MSALDTVRIMAIIVWLIVMTTSFPSLFRVMFGRARYLDTIKSVVGGFALLTILFNARWFLPFPTTTLWLGLYILSSAVGLSALWTMGRYEVACYD